MEIVKPTGTQENRISKAAAATVEQLQLIERIFERAQIPETDSMKAAALIALSTNYLAEVMNSNAK